MRSALPRALAAATCLAALTVTSAAAQSANITARATVQTALVVNAGDDLQFGPAFPGTTRTVLPTDAASGSFSLAGTANAEVNLTFTLPSNLASGPNLLPITFGTSSASRNTTNTRAASTTFNPNTPPHTTRLDAVTGNLFVFIGGTVQPTTQPAGSYTATVTLAAAYTGN